MFFANTWKATNSLTAFLSHVDAMAEYFLFNSSSSSLYMYIVLLVFSWFIWKSEEKTHQSYLCEL